MNLDHIDLKILAELAENAKATFAELGRKLGIHPNVVAYRVNRMQRGGIIKGYATVLDLEKMGIGEQMIVGINFPANSDREGMINRIGSIPEAVEIISSFGSPEGLILLAGRNKSDIERAISKIKSMNISIDYAASIIGIHRDGMMGKLLNQLASEIGPQSKALRPRGYPRELRGLRVLSVSK
jgi:Lrp/AsnC family leucine-responsive transcriptional regulator